MPAIESVINRCGMTFTDKVALITGGSKGIGEGCARVFVDAGAKVVICARGVADGEALAKELTEKGPGTCHFEQCDVSKPEDIERVVDRTVELYGRLDCLINNAGIHPPDRTIDDFTLEEFKDLLQVNLLSCFVASKRALPHLRKTRGSIINMGSLVSVMGQAWASIYCAAKAGMSGFTKSLAIEETRHGVRVNIVLPGNIISWGRVDAAAHHPRGEEWERWLDSHQPCGRSGTNEETGQLCLFLASDAASYITGIELIISGGSELGYGVKYPLGPLGGVV
ncbi:MAG: SDR family oxidoreductase [Armatimonadetes bacterium]|nr:SDR family oxidoreductase [Armatimonadota bacterium]